MTWNYKKQPHGGWWIRKGEEARIYVSRLGGSEASIAEIVAILNAHERCLDDHAEATS
jgi:hypothetical protein